MITKSKTALLQMKVSSAGRTFEAIVSDAKPKSARTEGGKGEVVAGNARAGRKVVTVMKTVPRI